MTRKKNGSNKKSHKLTIHMEDPDFSLANKILVQPSKISVHWGKKNDENFQTITRIIYKHHSHL